MDARKERMDEKEAWKILEKAETIWVAKGKKSQEFSPKKHSQEEILKVAMGPSGNLRAPTLKIKNKILIGFQEEFFANYFK